jgi:hypothetical protein
VDGWIYGWMIGLMDMSNSYRISGGKGGVNKSLGRPRHRLEYNI